MRLFFDVTCLMPEKISGVGVYAKNLSLELKKMVDLHFVLKGSRFLKISKASEHVQQSVQPYFDFLSPILFSRQGDVFHGPDFKLICQSKRVKKIVTIHDFAVFHSGYNSNDFRRRGQENIDYVINKIIPDCIVVPTNAIAEELFYRFPKFKGQCHRIFHGIDHLYAQSGQIISSLEREAYFLYVGNMEARKNIVNLVKAFDCWAQRHQDFKLVLVGRPGFGYEKIQEVIDQSQCRDRIDVRGYQCTQEISILYQKASGFVFPSFYEGFGFPILEAMLMKCPVLTSSYGAMAEVSGGHAILVDVDNIDSIQDGFDRLLQFTDTESAYQWAQSWTWKRSATEHLMLYGQ